MLIELGMECADRTKNGAQTTEISRCFGSPGLEGMLQSDPNHSQVSIDFDSLLACPELLSTAEKIGHAAGVAACVYMYISYLVCSQDWPRFCGRYISTMKTEIAQPPVAVFRAIVTIILLVLQH